MTVTSTILARLCHLPPRRVEAVTVQRDLPATMSDKVVLLADRWSPGTGDGRVPLVLLRSPYGRHQLGFVGRLLAERGYQVVIQSCRGTFGSGGEWSPLRNEQRDGHDTLTWLSSQSWCGDWVAMMGPSYLGFVQWAICDDPPPFLRALAPSVTAASFREGIIYPGGSYSLEPNLSWLQQLEFQERPPLTMLWTRRKARRRLQEACNTLPLSRADQVAAGRTVGFFQDWLTHDAPGDPWWEPVDCRPHRAKAPPLTMRGGWYDPFLSLQLDDLEAVQQAGGTARLTIGPWTHTSPAGMATALREALAWFDADSGTGGPAPRSAEPPIRLWVMNAKRWVDLPEWPPPATIERWHLHPGGLLDQVPAGDSPPDRYDYDPADPTPAAGGPSITIGLGGRKDQQPRESRRDVLSYTTAPFRRDTTVAGPLSLDLWFRSSLEHADVFVRLCLVSRKGRSFNLSDGVLRLQPGRQATEQDGSLRLRVELAPTAVTVRPGERLRLQVSSGAHPLVVRNLGTGEPLATGTAMAVAHQEVLHDRAHPSAIELPISSI